MKVFFVKTKCFPFSNQQDTYSKPGVSGLQLLYWDQYESTSTQVNWERDLHSGNIDKFLLIPDLGY